MVRVVTGQPRSMFVLVCLALTMCSTAVFMHATDGFYGTLFATLSEAVSRPATGPLSDDVYLCSEMNGMGSDDDVAVFALWFLLPLLLWRIWRFRSSTNWSEAVVFGLLSGPALLLQSIATCADIGVTLVVGQNLAFAGCLLGWTGAAAGYFWPSRNR